MFPDVDLIDFKLDDFDNLLKGNDISGIRLKMINILKGVFRHIWQYTQNAKKIFYVASLLLVVIDSYRFTFYGGKYE
jgi:hypothetical protein